jgi:hypothetical protein
MAPGVLNIDRTEMEEMCVYKPSAQCIVLELPVGFNRFTLEMERRGKTYQNHSWSRYYQYVVSYIIYIYILL